MRTQFWMASYALALNLLYWREKFNLHFVHFHIQIKGTEGEEYIHVYTNAQWQNNGGDGVE